MGVKIHGKKSSIIRNIKNRQLGWYGHVERMAEIDGQNPYYIWNQEEKTDEDDQPLNEKDTNTMPLNKENYYRVIEKIKVYGN